MLPRRLMIMNRFYQIAIFKYPLGSTAIEHREPPIQGEILVKVTDINTRGDFKLMVVDCDNEQHQTNLILPGVLNITEAKAIELARRYQPERLLAEFDRETGKKQSKLMPAVDLTQFYAVTPEKVINTKVK